MRHSEFPLLCGLGLLFFFSACQKDSEEVPPPLAEPPSNTGCSDLVTDIDGNAYTVVQIGNQCWMKENLRTSHYRNGIPIPSVTDSSSWIQLNNGGWIVHDTLAEYNSIYGKLYNWHAAANPYICPEGWHVPSDYEWQQLESALGMLSFQVNTWGWRGGPQNVGGKLKANILWNTPNAGATNESGFTGLPGGFRVSDFFISLGWQGLWWTATPSTTTTAWYRALSSQNTGSLRNDDLSKSSGLCVRCVKN